MNEPGIDLTGKLIIKVALGDDIRRILITNEDITYDELILMMQRVYRGQLTSNDDIVIKYKDEDNDLITIFDSSDLNFAIQCSRILKITLFVNGKPEPLQSDEVKMLKSELKHIRNRCNELLDKLDDRQPQDTPSSTADSSSSKVVPPSISESPQRMSPRPSAVPPTSQAGSKEFDPLSTQRSTDDQSKVVSSFGISNDERSGTPDSVSSIGSSSTRQQQGPTTPAQQGGQGAQYAPGSTPGSGQKVPPWQQQQPGAPSPYNQGPQGYQQSLMQSHTYTGHEHHESSPSVYPPHAPYPASSQSQQQQGFPSQPQTSQPGHGLPQTSQYGPGYSQPGQAAAQSGIQAGTPQPGQQPGAQPGQQPRVQPGQQPGAQPGQQPGAQPGQQPGAQPGQQPGAQPGQQPGAQVGQQPGVQQGFQPQGYGMIPPQQQQNVLPSQQQQMTTGQTPQQQQQAPQGSPYATYPQGQQGPGAAPGQGPPGSGNPYARQGPGYGAGYPRPTGNYPQGYQ